MKRLLYILNILIKKLIKYFGFSNKFFVIQYHPDSFSKFNSHQEFTKLKKKWIYKNEENNKGDINRLWFNILNIKKIIENKTNFVLMPDKSGTAVIIK